MSTTIQSVQSNGQEVRVSIKGLGSPVATVITVPAGTPFEVVAEKYVETAGISQQDAKRISFYQPSVGEVPKTKTVDQDMNVVTSQAKPENN